MKTQLVYSASVIMLDLFTMQNTMQDSQEAVICKLNMNLTEVVHLVTNTYFLSVSKLLPGSEQLLLWY